MSLLVSEFYLLRVTHAWKSGRFDLAEHFYPKISASRMASDPNGAEKAADEFNEIATDLLKTQFTDDAIRWLNRALSILNACDIEDPSGEFADLRLRIASNLGELLLQSSRKLFLTKIFFLKLQKK